MQKIEQVVWLSPDELTPYPENAKLHPPEQVDHIANSIKAFGWTQPIVVDENNVVVIGHGRLLAAKQLLLEKVPVVKRDDLTEEQINACRLADNKTNESDWDFSKLEEELAALSIAGFDMEQFGFDVDDWTDAKREIIEDEVPEVPAEPKAKRGDVYQLGEHRLMCGDSTDADDIAELMDGQNARMLFTSPPYSDMREYEGGKDLSVSNLCQFISKYRPYTDYQCVNLGIQRKNNDIYEYWNDYISEARSTGYKMLAWNVWDKCTVGNIGQERAFQPIRHEWVFVFGTEYFETNRSVQKNEESIINKKQMKSGRQADGSLKPHTSGDQSKPFKRMESIQRIYPVLNSNVSEDHPAAFPVELPAEYIKSMSDENDIIIEPFGGSGTTLIACHELKRKCRIMELEPKYIDVIIKRWEDFTGLKAELIKEGDTN